MNPLERNLTVPDTSPVHKTTGPWQARSALWLTCGVIIVALAYWPGMSGGFIFDDYPNIVSRDAIHLDTLTWRGLWDAAFSFQHGGLARPAANVTFALNHAADGLDPRGYKWANLAIHLLNTLLVAMLVRHVLLLADAQQRLADFLAVFATLLWAAHPLQVSTVLYVVQRMELMCVTFTLIALLAYTRGRQAQLDGSGSGVAQFLTAAVAMLFGLSSKENALLIPVYGLALEALILRYRALNLATRRSWRLLTIVGAATLIIAVVAGNLYLVLRQPGYSMRDFTASARLLSQLEILPGYLGQILLPQLDSMKFFYDDLDATARLSWTHFAGISMLAALAAAAAWLHSRRPVASLGIFFFIASHLITSSAAALELAFEHRNYFALLGVIVGLIGLLPLSARNLPLRPLIAGAAAIFLVFASLTAIRSSYWSEPGRLAAYLVEINPQSPRAAMDLGEQYMLASGGNAHSPFYQLAESEYRRAAQLPPRSIMGEHGLIMMAAHYGHPSDPRTWEDLNRKLSTPPVRPQEIAALLGMVEHRMKGLPLDDRELAAATTSVARVQPLAPELLFLFANQALLSDDGGRAARELFARGLVAADPQYAARARSAILSLTGQEFLEAVNAEAKRIELELP